MTDLKSKKQLLDPNVHAMDMSLLTGPTGNIYHSLAIISKRANQVAVALKEELRSKLDEFAENTETIEEVMENKEQIEISKSYEKLPNPAIIAMNEFLNKEVVHRLSDQNMALTGTF